MTEKKLAKGEVAVTFARDWAIGDKSFEPGKDYVLTPGEADEVLRFGYARPHDPVLAKAYGFPVPAEKKGV